MKAAILWHRLLGDLSGKGKAKKENVLALPGEHNYLLQGECNACAIAIAHSLLGQELKRRNPYEEEEHWSSNVCPLHHHLWDSHTFQFPPTVMGREAGRRGWEGQGDLFSAFLHCRTTC